MGLFWLHNLWGGFLIFGVYVCWLAIWLLFIGVLFVWFDAWVATLLCFDFADLIRVLLPYFVCGFYIICFIDGDFGCLVLTLCWGFCLVLTFDFGINSNCVFGVPIGICLLLLNWWISLLDGFVLNWFVDEFELVFLVGLVSGC